MTTNTFVSQWLRAANSTAGTWRGFWTAEWARQQTALVTEFNKQAMAFWTGAFAARPGVIAPSAEQARVARTSEVPEAVPLPAVNAAPSAPIEAPIAETTPKAARKPARKAAKPPARPVPPKRATARRHTRH